MIKNLSRNILIVFSGDIGARVLGFLATIHIARVLGTENFGYIIIGLSILAYAMWFSDLGLATLGTREIARPYDKRSFQLPDVLFLKFFLAAVIFLIAGSLLHFIELDSRMSSVIQLYLLFLFVEAFLPEWYFKGARRYFPLTITRWLSGIIYACTVYLFIKQPDHLERVPVCYIGAHLPTILLLLLLKRKEDILRFSLGGFSKYLSMLSRSVKIGGGSILGQVVQLLPPLTLGYFYSSTEAGIFGAAMKIMVFCLVLDRVFVTLFLPAMSNLWATSPETLAVRLSIVSKIIVFGSFSASTIIAIFSAPLINLIYGSPYGNGHNALLILSWFIIPTLLNSLFAFSLIAMGNEKLYFQSTLKGSTIAALMIVGGSYLGELNGAAMGVILGEMGIISFVYREFQAFFKINLIKPLLLAGLLSMGFLIIFSAVDLQQIWVFPLIWLGYLGCILLFKGIRARDLTLLFQK